MPRSCHPERGAGDYPEPSGLRGPTRSAPGPLPPAGVRLRRTLALCWTFYQGEETIYCVPSGPLLATPRFGPKAYIVLSLRPSMVYHSDQGVGRACSILAFKPLLAYSSDQSRALIAFRPSFAKFQALHYFSLRRTPCSTTKLSITLHVWAE